MPRKGNNRIEGVAGYNRNKDPEDLFEKATRKGRSQLANDLEGAVGRKDSKKIHNPAGETNLDASAISGSTGIDVKVVEAALDAGLKEDHLQRHKETYKSVSADGALKVIKLSSNETVKDAALRGAIIRGLKAAQKKEVIRNQLIDNSDYPNLTEASVKALEGVNVGLNDLVKAAPSIQGLTAEEVIKVVGKYQGEPALDELKSQASTAKLKAVFSEGLESTKLKGKIIDELVRLEFSINSFNGLTKHGVPDQSKLLKLLQKPAHNISQDGRKAIVRAYQKEVIVGDKANIITSKFYDTLFKRAKQAGDKDVASKIKNVGEQAKLAGVKPKQISKYLEKHTNVGLGEDGVLGFIESEKQAKAKAKEAKVQAKATAKEIKAKAKETKAKAKAKAKETKAKAKEAKAQAKAETKAAVEGLNEKNHGYATADDQDPTYATADAANGSGRDAYAVPADAIGSDEDDPGNDGVYDEVQRNQSGAGDDGYAELQGHEGASSDKGSGELTKPIGSIVYASGDDIPGESGASEGEPEGPEYSVSTKQKARGAEPANQQISGSDSARYDEPLEEAVAQDNNVKITVWEKGADGSITRDAQFTIGVDNVYDTVAIPVDVEEFFKNHDDVSKVTVTEDTSTSEHSVEVRPFTAEDAVMFNEYRAANADPAVASPGPAAAPQRTEYSEIAFDGDFSDDEGDDFENDGGNTPG